MFLVRWALVGMFGYTAYRSGFASGGGILTGLFAPAGAIMLEAVYQVVTAIRQNAD